MPVPREMSPTLFVQAVGVRVGVYVLKNKDHGATFHFLRCENHYLTCKRRNKGGTAEWRSLPGGEVHTLFWGISLSLPVTQSCQSSSLRERGGVQSPMGPFCTLSGGANHFTRVSRHPNAHDRAVMAAMITDTNPFSAYNNCDGVVPSREDQNQ